MGTAKGWIVALAVILDAALAGAAAAQGHVQRMLTVEDGLVHSHVLSIGEDRDGFLWFGTADGVSRFDGLAFANFRSGDGLPEGLVETIHQAPEGPLYFGTTGGAAVFEQGRIRPLADRHLAEIAVRAIVGGPGGTVYFGTPQGVVVVRPDGRSELLPKGGAEFYYGVAALLVGRDRTLYAGSDGGLLIYRGEKLVRVLRKTDGLPARGVWSLAEGRDGTLYLGTGQGLALARNGSLLNTPRRFDQPVSSVLEGADGTVYLGTPLSGAFFGRPPSSLRQVTQVNGLTWSRVEAVHQARDGTVYFGTDEGVGVYQPRAAIQSWTWRTGLPQEVVRSIVEDSRGRISVRTYEGGARFEAGRWHSEAVVAVPADERYLGKGQELILHETGREADQVHSLRTGRDGIRYVGTPQGLAIFRAGHPRRDELTEDSVYCILDDGAGRLYVSTRRGIKRIDPAVAPVAVEATWTSADGLAGEIGVPGACYRDRAGRLWFGSYTGVSVIDPTVEKPRREPPRARISGVELAGKEILPPPAGELLALASHQRHIAVSFLAVELAEPHRVRYRYRIAELDPSWRETTLRAVQLSELPPGEHTFEVAAAVGDGRWGEPARLRWEVPTPFYRRWWFLGLPPLAAACLAAAVATWRARHLLALERLRTAIAADLHDHIGSGLTEIAFLAETGEPSRVAGIARDLTRQLGDTVWLIHPRRDSLDQLFLRLKDTYAELFAQEGAVFRTVDLSVFERVRLPVIDRQNLYLIFKEAFHNVFRHAGCREVALDVSVEGRRLEVVLTDDGRGFDPEAVNEEGDGLANMQRRAAAIGGRLAIESEPGCGTVVRYSGPLR